MGVRRPVGETDDGSRDEPSEPQSPDYADWPGKEFELNGGINFELPEEDVGVKKTREAFEDIQNDIKEESEEEKLVDEDYAAVTDVPGTAGPEDGAAEGEPTDAPGT